MSLVCVAGSAVHIITITVSGAGPAATTAMQAPGLAEQLNSMQPSASNESPMENKTKGVSIV